MGKKQIKNLKSGDRFGDTQKVAILRDQIKQLIHESHEHFLLFSGGRSVGKTFSSQIAIFLEEVLPEGGKIRLLIHKKGLIKKGVLKGWWKKMLRETGTASKYDFKWTGELGYYRLKEHDEDDWTLFADVLWTGDAEDDKLFNDPDLRWLVMDETAIAGARPDEVREMVDSILKIYETHDRLEGRVRFLALCNTIDATNPIYEAFAVPPGNLSDDHVGEIIRGEDTMYWYVPRPADLEEQAKEISKTIRQMSKTYAGYSEGHFRSWYGSYIKEPKGITFSSVFAIKMEDLCYAGFGKGSDGNLYVESWNKDQFKTCEKRFVIDAIYVTDEEKMLPERRKMIICQSIQRGKLKFCTLEDLTIFSNRFKVFGLKIS